jgi:protein-disulfide isomerase-like protein with CxxC motif
MRLATAASLISEEKARAVAHALYRAYWAEGRDIADRAVVGAIAREHGIPESRIDAQDVKDRLRAVTDEAVQAGAFGAGEQSGGAALVQLAASGDVQQLQRPISESDDPEWIDRQVAYVAQRMRGAEFTARVNSFCGHCDLQKCCPLHAGRQVTQ